VKNGDKITIDAENAHVESRNPSAELKKRKKAWKKKRPPRALPVRAAPYAAKVTSASLGAGRMQIKNYWIGA